VEIQLRGDRRQVEWRALDEAERRAAGESFRDAHPIYTAVVVFIRMRTKGLGSCIETERKDAEVFTLAHGKIVRLDYFNDRRQALQAAGLSE
jgi:hypothetical protein